MKNNLKEEINRSKQLMGINESLYTKIVGNKCDYESLSKAVKEYTQKVYGRLNPKFYDNDPNPFEKGTKGVTVGIEWENYRQTDNPDKEIRKFKNVRENEYKQQFKDFCEKGLKGQFGMYNQMVDVNASCQMERMEYVEDPYKKYSKRNMLVRYTEHGREVLDDRHPSIQEILPKFNGNKEQWSVHIYVSISPFKE